MAQTSRSNPAIGGAVPTQFSPEIRTDFGRSDEHCWIQRYGFEEHTVGKPDDNSVEDGRFSRRRKYRKVVRERPGLVPSPLFHIIGNTVFLRLPDVASGLPSYEEQVMLSSMDSEEDATGYSQRRAYNTAGLCLFAIVWAGFVLMAEGGEERGGGRAKTAVVMAVVGLVLVLSAKGVAALLSYTIPMPDDSPIPGRNAEEMALNGSVLSTVKNGGPECTVLRTCIFGYMGEFPYRAVPSAADRPNFGHGRPSKSEGRRTHP